MAKARPDVLRSLGVNRKLKFLVVLLMLAIMPVRALATVTTGFCAMDLASSGVLESGHGGHHPGDDDWTSHGDDHKHDGCNACVGHCAGGAIVALRELPLPPVFGAVRISSGEPFAGGFIPEHLDPPPLAG